MVVCNEEKGLRFPCSEGFTDILEESVKRLDGGKTNGRKTEVL